MELTDEQVKIIWYFANVSQMKEMEKAFEAMDYGHVNELLNGQATSLWTKMEMECSKRGINPRKYDKTKTKYKQIPESQMDKIAKDIASIKEMLGMVEEDVD
jgi:hypothetical protein